MVSCPTKEGEEVRRVPEGCGSVSLIVGDVIGLIRFVGIVGFAGIVEGDGGGSGRGWLHHDAYHGVGHGSEARGRPFVRFGFDEMHDETTKIILAFTKKRGEGREGRTDGEMGKWGTEKSKENLPRHGNKFGQVA